MHALEEIEKMTARTLYRELFKNMKFYPSKNRFNILLALREEFRDHANLKDPKKIEIELKKARIGLSHLDLYKKKSVEFVSMYRMKDEEFSRGLNPKNKDFIYFWSELIFLPTFFLGFSFFPCPRFLLSASSPIPKIYFPIVKQLFVF